MPRKARDPTFNEFALLDRLVLGHSVYETESGNWRIAGRGIKGWSISFVTIAHCNCEEWVRLEQATGPRLEYAQVGYRDVKLTAKGKRAHYRTGMRET